jgi:signal transduction histidine kinase
MATGPSDRIAEEQAALRRLAVLVAGGAPPEEVFVAVTAEIGRVLAADLTSMSQYDAGGTATVVGTWSKTGAAMPIPVGLRLPPGGRNIHTLVVETGRPARIDDYANASGPAADTARELGLRSAVGAPISVEGRLWGFMSAMSTSDELLPTDTERRLAGFTELVGTAIANAQARVELRGFAEEQAALRRMATVVARAALPEEVFAAVTAEVGRVLSADVTVLARYDPDGVHTSVGAWSSTGGPVPFPVGSRTALGGRNVISQVFETARPARMDDYADASGPTGDIAQRWRTRSVVGVPISVAGRLWGVMCVGSNRAQPVPADTEARLAGFTELVGTAIANAQTRLELHGFAEEQAALRRVATLVARAAPPDEVFAAVTAEVGRALSADFSTMSRYDTGGVITIVGQWTSTGVAAPVAVGAQLSLGGQNATTLVFHTRRPARIDYSRDPSGPIADAAREWGFNSAVGVPIDVEGRLWGVVTVGSTRERSLPADTEARLAGFTQLVATAIANADAQAALTASRARIVAAADTTRRRIERDLHDGAQQRLVSLALHLRSTVQAAVPPGADRLTAQVDRVAADLVSVVDDLRELARGLHPAVLAEGGLYPALKTLARRSTVPVRLDVGVAGRLPEPIELATYYVVSEALTNTVKHADATVIDIHAASGEGVLRVEIRDDGCGGADPTGGTGLIGLTDRVEALGGRLTLDSPPGAGTALQLVLPLTAPRGPGPPTAVTTVQEELP